MRATDGWPALRAVQVGPHLDEPIPFLGGQRARQVWKASATTIQPQAVSPIDVYAGNRVKAALHRVLEDGASIDQALAEAKAEIEEKLRP